MYALKTYEAAATVWDLANAEAVSAAAGRSGFTLVGALDIVSQGHQWLRAEQAFQADPTNEQSHLFVTNELNTILAEVTGLRPGAFPAFLVGNNPFVTTEEGVAFVSLPSGYKDNNHQIYAGITEKLIFVRVFMAKPVLEDFTRDVGEEQASNDGLELKYEYILQYGDNGAVIQARGLFETFDNDDLQEFVFKLLKNALLPHVFNAHQAVQLKAELLRFTHSVDQYDSDIERSVEDDKPLVHGQTVEDVAKTKLLGAYYAYFEKHNSSSVHKLADAIKEFLGLN